jgi:hypothetical protein
MNDLKTTALDPDDIMVPAVNLRTRYGGKSDMWIHRLQKSDPDFPKPIVIRHQRYWRLSELVAYENKKRGEQNGSAR